MCIKFKTELYILSSISSAAIIVWSEIIKMSWTHILQILYSSFLSYVSPLKFYSIREISFLQNKKWVNMKQNISRVRKYFENWIETTVFWYCV